MIEKEKALPLKLMQLEALLRRIPFEFEGRQLIEVDLARCKTGYRGEKSLEYYLRFLDERKNYIFHDLRLTNHIGSFQIDILILTPSYFLTLEVKNLSGKITIDPRHQQMTRLNTLGQLDVFPDPLSQVRRQKTQLELWLTAQKITGITIKTLVVMANPKAQLDYLASVPLQEITRADNLPFAVEKINELYKNHAPVLEKKSIRRICTLLLKHHDPGESDILSRYKINRSSLISGVLCPQCEKIPMKKMVKNWICPKCKCLDKEAYKEALQDYGLLISPMITNFEFRDFLHIQSIHVASKMLLRLKLPASGHTKGRKYKIPLN